MFLFQLTKVLKFLILSNFILLFVKKVYVFFHLRSKSIRKLTFLMPELIK